MFSYLVNNTYSTNNTITHILHTDYSRELKSLLFFPQGLIQSKKENKLLFKQRNSNTHVSKKAIGGWLGTIFQHDITGSPSPETTLIAPELYKLCTTGKIATWQLCRCGKTYNFLTFNWQSSTNTFFLYSVISISYWPQLRTRQKYNLDQNLSIVRILQILLPKEKKIRQQHNKTSRHQTCCKSYPALNKLNPGRKNS